MKIFKGQGTADLGKPWRFEEDGLTVTRGCAWSPPGCHPTGCGIKTYVNAAGELVKIEGDENHPITNGRLCVRCLAIRDYVYNPDRVRYPMKRAREDRGKDSVGAHHLGRGVRPHRREGGRCTRKNYGAESVPSSWAARAAKAAPCIPAYAQACIGTAERRATRSPAARAIVPRVAGIHVTCWAPRISRWTTRGGLPGRYDDPMFELPELIVFWGQASPCRPNRRRPVRPCRRRHDAPRLEAHVRRAARELAVSTRAELASAAAPRAPTRRWRMGHAATSSSPKTSTTTSSSRTGATASKSSPSAWLPCRWRRLPRSRAWMPTSSARRRAPTQRRSRRRSPGAWASTRSPTACRPATASWRSRPSRATSTFRAASSSAT